MNIKTYFLLKKLRNIDKYFKYVQNADYKKMIADSLPTVQDKYYLTKGNLNNTSIANVTTYLPLFDQLDEKYNLKSIAIGNTDYEKATNLLSWLSSHTYYSGAASRLLPDCAMQILEYSFDKGFQHAINCRDKAICFTDCLVAVGIKAYPICMTSTNFQACHFVCHVYLRELDLWCVFDPSFNCSFHFENQPIDIFSLRNLLLTNQNLDVKNYSFNGTNNCFNEYLDGFLRLCISNLSTYHDNSENNRFEKNIKKLKEFDCTLPLE